MTYFLKIWKYYKVFQHSPLGHSEPLHEQYFQMESAPDLQMTIVLTLCLLYKIISAEAISAIAIEVVNKTHTHRHIHTLNVAILSKGSFTHVHFLVHEQYEIDRKIHMPLY